MDPNSVLVRRLLISDPTGDQRLPAAGPAVTYLAGEAREPTRWQLNRRNFEHYSRGLEAFLGWP